MEGPTREVVLAHLGLAHGIEEELEVPDNAGHGGEDVVGDEGLGGEAVVGGGIKRVKVDEGIAGGVRGAHRVGAGFAEELADGAVLEDENGGPDEVGDEASPENDDEDWKVLPEVHSAGCKKLGLSEVADRLSCIKTEGEERAHESGEDSDGYAFAEVVVGFAGLGLFFGRDLALLRHAGSSVGGYADDADQDAEQDDLAGGLMEDRPELVVGDRRNDGPERSAEAERDRVTERDAEVANSETEGDAADAPENSEEEGQHDTFGVSEVDLVDDAEEIWDEDGAEDDRRDDPCGEALDEPVDLPRPALDAAEGDEVGGGGETSNPVKDDAEKRIRSHEASFC